ncbi:MAG: hypothetical protein M3018_07815 [Actinomycetota bacterium]|nr:hypothetical protein [Actinomycetota bacterium]
MQASKLLRRVGILRRIPIARLLAVAEVVMLARQHLQKLDPEERRRFLALIGRGRGRPSRLTDSERAELTTLVLKADPRQFAFLAAERLSPVPLPDRILRRKR